MFFNKITVTCFNLIKINICDNYLLGCKGFGYWSPVLGLPPSAFESEPGLDGTSG